MMSFNNCWHRSPCLKMSSATDINLQQLISLQQKVGELAVRRKHIRSALSGAHLSRLRGRGMEFDEVRIYQPGDEVSSIDWKVTARKGTTHTKIFREERERPILICLDYRRSMFFATQGSLKSVIATQAAALLAWHSISHGDRLGACLFSEQAHHDIKPTRGRKGVLKFLHGCCHSEAWQQQHTPLPATTLDETAQRLRRLSRPGSLVYILSDFRGLTPTSINQLGQLARHSDVVLVAIHDVMESHFPASGEFPVFDGKQHFTFLANRQIQQAFQQQYQQRMAQLEQLKKQHGIHLIEISTTDEVSQIIRERLWAV